MQTLDWILIIVYCVLLFGIAFHFQRKAAKSVEGFFLADRDLPWWVIGLSDSAAYTGGGQAFVTIFFLGGFAGLWLMAWVSWVIWMPLVAVIWARMWHRLGVLTTGEFIERRYSGRPARIFRNVYAIYAATAWGVTALAYGSAWMAATLSPLLGWSPAMVLAVFGGVTLVYIMMSGFFAVAYNDVFQFAILMISNLILGIVLVSHVGGFSAAWHKVEALRGAGFLNPWPVSKDLTFPSLLALCLQGLFFAGSPFAGEGWTAQRYLAARSETHAVVGQLFNAFLALVFRLIPFLMIGLAAAALWKPESVAVPSEMWGELVKQYASPGLFGLLLVGGLAGYMAGLSSIVNWAASYVMNDFYRLSFRPHASQREYIWAGRVASGVLLIVALILGGLIDPKKLDRWVFFINSALVVFPLPLAWLKWFWWRTNVYGEMVGVLGALPAGYLVWFGSDEMIPAGLRAAIHSMTGWNMEGLVPAFGDLTRFPFWAGFSILFGLGTIAILTATLLTRPESPEILKSFYQKVQPIGWWKPVRTALGEDGRAARAEAMRGIRLCCFGVGLYFFMAVAFFAVLGGRFFEAALCSAGMVIMGALFLRKALQQSSYRTDSHVPAEVES